MGATGHPETSSSPSSSFLNLLASSINATSDSGASKAISSQPPSFLFPEPSRPSILAAQQHASPLRHQSTGLVLGATACALALVCLIVWCYLICWRRYRKRHGLTREHSLQHRPASTNPRNSSMRYFCRHHFRRHLRLPRPPQVENCNDVLCFQSQPSLSPPKVKNASLSSSPHERQLDPICRSGFNLGYQQLSNGGVVLIRGSKSLQPSQEGTMTPCSGYVHSVPPSSSPQRPSHNDVSMTTPPSPKGSTSRASVATTSGLSVLSHCTIRSDCHYHLPYYSTLPQIVPQNQKQLQQKSCQPCLPEVQTRRQAQHFSEDDSFAPTRAGLSPQWQAEMRPAMICKLQSTGMAPSKRPASRIQQPIKERALSFLRKSTEDISQPRVARSKFSETSQRPQRTINLTSSSHDVVCTTENDDLEVGLQIAQQRSSQVNVDCTLSPAREIDRVARLSKLMKATNEALDIATVTFGTVQESEMWLAGSHSSCSDHARQLEEVVEENIDSQTTFPKQDVDGEDVFRCSDGANHHDDDPKIYSVQFEPYRCAPWRRPFLDECPGDLKGFTVDKADEAHSSLVQEERIRSEPCHSLMHDRCSRCRPVDSESVPQHRGPNLKPSPDRVRGIQHNREEQQQQRQQQKSSTFSPSDASLSRAANISDLPERTHYIDQISTDICDVGAANFSTNDSTYDQHATSQGPSAAPSCVYTSQTSEREQQQGWLSKPPTGLSFHCGEASCTALAPEHRISSTEVLEEEKLESHASSLVRSAAHFHAEPSLRSSIGTGSTSCAEPSFRNGNIRSERILHRYRPEGQVSGGERNGSLNSVGRGPVEKKSFVVETRQRHLATVATRTGALSSEPTLSGFIVESRLKKKHISGSFPK